jgi:hypothetical protein
MRTSDNVVWWTLRAFAPMENGRRSDSRAQNVELAKTNKNRQKVVPNQALYQAEPQPVLPVKTIPKKYRYFCLSTNFIHCAEMWFEATNQKRILS